MAIMDIEAVESKNEVSRRLKEIVTKWRDVFETPHKHKDGAVFDVLVRAKAIVFDDKTYIVSTWTESQPTDGG